MSGKVPTPPTTAPGVKKEKTPIIPHDEQPPPPLEPGDLVGNFSIVSKIGDGGMGCVYKAKQIHTGVFAAVKVLHPKYARHEQITKRLISEGRAASSLRHDNIVTVHDVGQRETGEWYIVLDYLDGSPLQKTMASWGGPMDLETIMTIAAQIASPLAKAHKAGIIHRDLKPENVFLTQRETNDRHVTILDFGVAHVPNEDGSEGDTRTGVILGTPTYMAPEQLRGEKIDHRIDIYAFGVMLWEMSTGQRLWDGAKGNPAQIGVMQVSGARPLNPCKILPSLPPAWGAAIERALALDPNDRFASMGDLARALALALPARPWSPNGFAILNEHAKELAKVPIDADTAGRPSNRANEPTVRVLADAAAPLGVPDVALTPPPAIDPHAVSRSALTVSDRPFVPPPIAVSTPQEPTTHGGATGQAMSVAPRASQRRLIAITAGATAGVVLAAIVASNLGGGGDARPAVQPAIDAAAITSALAIVTEPDGATIVIDGATRGEAPFNMAATVGAEIEIRAELANHTPAVERVRIGATPSTVRLTLSLLVDAGVTPIDAAAPIDAAPRRSSSGRRRTPLPPERGSSAWDPDDVVDP